MEEFTDRYVMGFLGKLVPSLLWILYRCYQVLSTPVDELVQELRIDIPFSPTVCVDSVSETSVVLHWDIQIKRDENLYFLLVVNGHEAARLTGTSCKVDGLLPGKLYRLNIVAVNSLTNFRSQLKATFIQTIDTKNAKLNDLLQTCDVTEDIEKLTEATSTNADLASGAEEWAKDLPTDINVAEVSKCTDVQMLHYYLHKYQQELIKINAETKNFEEKSRKEIESLKDQEKVFKSELDTESDNRAKKDNDVKSYEHKKADLAFMKSKLTANVKQLESANDIMKSRISLLRSDTESKKTRNITALESKDEQIKEMYDKINEYKVSNALVRKENEEIENSVKSLKVKRKELTKLLENLKPVVEAFQIEFLATRDGPISRNAIEILLEINKIAGPEWEREINNEVNTYDQFEMDWKSTYRFEIRKYISLQHSFEIAKLNKDKSYQPQKMTEYQASIEFGGYQNALINRPLNQYFPQSSNSLINIVQSATGSNTVGVAGKFKRHHNNHYYARDPSVPYSGSSNSNVPTPEFMSNSSSSASQVQQQQLLQSHNLETQQTTVGSVPLGSSSSSVQTNNVALDSNFNINALANAAANDVNMSTAGYNDFDFYYPVNNESANDISLQMQAQNQASNPPQVFNVSSVPNNSISNENKFNFASHYQDIYYGDSQNAPPLASAPSNQVMTVPMMQNAAPSLDYLLANNSNNIMLNFDDSNGSFNFETNNNATGSGAASLTGGIGQQDTSDHLIGSPLPDMMQLSNGTNSALLPNVNPNNVSSGIVSTTPLLGMNAFNGRIGTLSGSNTGAGTNTSGGSTATTLGGSTSTNSMNPVSNFNAQATGTYASPFWNNMQVGSTTAPPAPAYNLGAYSQSPDFLNTFNDDSNNISNPFGRGLNTLSPSPIIVNNLGLTGTNGNNSATVGTPALPSSGIFFGNTTPGSGNIHSSGGDSITGSKVNDALDDTDSIHGTPTTTGLPSGHGLQSSAGANGGLLWDYGLGYHRRNVSNGPIWRNDNLSASSFTMSGGPGASAPAAIGTRSRSNTFNTSNTDPDALGNRPSSSTLF